LFSPVQSEKESEPLVDRQHVSPFKKKRRRVVSYPLYSFGKIMINCKGSKIEILKSINGEFRPGDLTAIMGGSGK